MIEQLKAFENAIQELAVLVDKRKMLTQLKTNAENELLDKQSEIILRNTDFQALKNEKQREAYLHENTKNERDKFDKVSLELMEVNMKIDLLEKKISLYKRIVDYENNYLAKVPPMMLK